MSLVSCTRGANIFSTKCKACIRLVDYAGGHSGTAAKQTGLFSTTAPVAAVAKDGDDGVAGTQSARHPHGAHAVHGRRGAQEQAVSRQQVPRLWHIGKAESAA